MIKLTIACIASLAIAGAATAQMSNGSAMSNSSAMSDSPASATSGKTPVSGSMSKTHMMKKKMAKGTSHNGRSGMPTSGADSSGPLTNSTTPPQ